jgi:hypothetical protein
MISEPFGALFMVPDGTCGLVSMNNYRVHEFEGWIIETWESKCDDCNFVSGLGTAHRKDLAPLYAHQSFINASSHQSSTNSTKLESLTSHLTPCPPSDTRSPTSFASASQWQFLSSCKNSCSISIVGAGCNSRRGLREVILLLHDFVRRSNSCST